MFGPFRGEPAGVTSRAPARATATEAAPNGSQALQVGLLVQSNDAPRCGPITMRTTPQHPNKLGQRQSHPATSLNTLRCLKLGEAIAERLGVEDVDDLSLLRVSDLRAESRGLLQVVLVLADDGFNLLVALGAMRAINLANHLLALGDFGQGEQLARLLPGPFKILIRRFVLVY